MTIFLVYSTSGITSGKKVCRELNMATILKNFNSFNLTSDMKKKQKTSQIMQKNVSMVMTSSMTSQGGLKVSLYIHVLEKLAPVASCKGNVSSINANIVIVFLDYTCQKTISMNNTFREVNVTGLLGDLGT